jgi:hypothetical protein
MRLTHLLFAICVSLLSAGVSSQSTPATLSEPLRTHFKSERLDIVSSIRGLPLDVRGELQRLFDSQSFDIALDIAEPGARFQETDVLASPKLPIRRLVKAGCSIDHCLVYYERGGRARTGHVALFHWTPAATRFESGGIAPSGLVTIEAVRTALLSGAIKGPARVW